jgi:hypothetical protein
MNKIEKVKEFEFNPLIQPNILEFLSSAGLPHFNPQELFAKSNPNIFQNTSINGDKSFYTSAKYPA